MRETPFDYYTALLHKELDTLSLFITEKARVKEINKELETELKDRIGTIQEKFTL